VVAILCTLSRYLKQTGDVSPDTALPGKCTGKSLPCAYAMYHVEQRPHSGHYMEVSGQPYTLATGPPRKDSSIFMR
jgi:hypothetical protein